MFSMFLLSWCKVLVVVLPKFDESSRMGTDVLPHNLLLAPHSLFVALLDFEWICGVEKWGKEKGDGAAYIVLYLWMFVLETWRQRLLLWGCQLFLFWAWCLCLSYLFGASYGLPTMADLMDPIFYSYGASKRALLHIPNVSIPSLGKLEYLGLW